MASALVLHLARLAGYCGLAIIVALSLVPGDERPHTGLAGGVEHGLAYALTALSLAIGHPPARRRAMSGLGLVFLAAVLEVMQIAVPGRVADVSDVAASALGGLAGVALVLALQGLSVSVRRRTVPLPDVFTKRAS